MKTLPKAAIILGGVVLAVIVYRLGGPQGPMLSDVEHLRLPRIAKKESRKMHVVVAEGSTAKEIFGSSIGTLISSHYRLFGSPIGPITGRWWNVSDKLLRAEVGLEIPLNAVEPTPDKLQTTRIVQWDYEGTVAEILHVGSYREETPTIALLKKFIADQGYDYLDAHEEEYLRGPGFIFAGDPATYLTLIRYPVRERAKGQPEK